MNGMEQNIRAAVLVRAKKLVEYRSLFLTLIRQHSQIPWSSTGMTWSEFVDDWKEETSASAVGRHRRSGLRSLRRGFLTLVFFWRSSSPSDRCTTCFGKVYLDALLLYPMGWCLSRLAPQISVFGSEGATSRVVHAALKHLRQAWLVKSQATAIPTIRQHHLPACDFARV